MNGVNRDLFTYRRRLSGTGGAAANYDGPGDVEAAARDYNVAVIYTDISEIDSNVTVTRIVEGAVRFVAKEVGGYLRVRYEVEHDTTQGGATFGSGITYKQT